MKVTIYGSRGSISISNARSTKIGGNSTSLRVESLCLPKGTVLAIDAGSGYVPLSADAAKANAIAVELLQTHYHHDHTIGMSLAPHTFMHHVPVRIWGPIDRKKGPKEIYSTLLQHPFFPVDWKQLEAHFSFKPLEVPSTKVILVHPEGGFQLMSLAQFTKIKQAGALFPIGKAGGKYGIKEILVIKMLNTIHPDQTVSYRFEEGPTGKVFTFVTDQEATAGLAGDLKAHCADSDLLIMDCQYTMAKYANAVGFGHGNTEFCVSVALATGSKALGLTHHAPFSTDEDVEALLTEAKTYYRTRTGTANDKNAEKKTALKEQSIFACYDYQQIEVL